jgi:hypothetical protein
MTTKNPSQPSALLKNSIEYWFDGENLLPLFPVTQGKKIRTIKTNNVIIEYCSLTFICPKCKKENSHGSGLSGINGLKGDHRGHRGSDCPCWPLGYFLIIE